MNEFTFYRDIAVQKWDAEINRSDIPVIYLGAASCGIAAGALDILDTIKETVNELGQTVRFVQVGCIGPCYLEPIMDIALPGSPRVSYTNVNPQKVKKILKATLVDRDYASDLATGHFGGEEFSVKTGKDDAERMLLWKGRKAAFAAMGQISPAYYVQDGVIPRTQILKILGEIDDLSKKYGLRVANVFHAGDGNLHPLILYDDGVEGQVERAEAMGSEIMERCIAVGGSITGEHGVGFEKRDFMPLMYSPADLEAMAKVKRVWNPDGLLNPGKIFPTSKSCVEVGATGKTRDIGYKPHRIERDGTAQRF